MSSVAKGLFVAVFASTKIYLLGRLREELIFKDEIVRVRDIEINSKGEIYLIADEYDSNLYILQP